MEDEIEILLVEDNPGDAELALRALRKQNLLNKVIHLNNGAEALDFIYGEGKYTHRSIDNLPKIILLDLNMPLVNGIEFLERIKEDPRTSVIKVVILTSSSEDPDIKRCQSLGANSYIIKPVDFGNFSKTMAELGMYWKVINKIKQP